MLAGAIWEKLGGTTIGLHLGQTESTIDVSLPEGRTHLTEEEIQLLENTVNERIRMDAPIRCWFPDEEELKRLPLRKADGSGAGRAAARRAALRLEAALPGRDHHAFRRALRPRLAESGP